MSRFGLVLAVIGVVVAYIGFEESRLAAVADVEPLEVTCLQLETEGYGDNAHVVIRDFVPSLHGFVYETSDNADRWDRVWLPLLSSESEYLQRLQELADTYGVFDVPKEEFERLSEAAEFRVLLKSTALRSEAAVDQFGGPGETVRGLIVNAVESLGSDERRLLTESYPNVDIDQVFIVEHNRSPRAQTDIMYFWAGSALLLFLGIGMIVRHRRAKKVISPPPFGAPAIADDPTAPPRDGMGQDGPEYAPAEGADSPPRTDPPVR